jgi:hypothetical protein
MVRLVAAVLLGQSAGSAALAAAAAQDGTPVQVWMSPGGPLRRGGAAHVYVRTARDGYLVVLHRRTDGRIEMLFPATPADETFTPAGTYEIRAGASDAAFVVAEPDGAGVVFAALSDRAYRFDEFARGARWDPGALVPSWSGADAEGALSDIVQRMLGDDYFNYDAATYTVAPASFAMQETAAASQYRSPPPCIDCTFIGVQEIVLLPAAVCDPLLFACFPAHPRRFPPASGICGIDTPCPEHTSAVALALAPRVPLPADGRRRQPAAVPRPATPGGAARPAARARVSSQLPAVVRLTLSPTRPPEEPQPAGTGTQVHEAGPAPRGLVAAPAPAAPGAAPAPNGAAPATAWAVGAPRSMATSRLGGGGSGSGSGSGGGQAGAAAGGAMRAIALPPAVWRGAGRRLPVATARR